ncbi:hypothetical protein [Candidatus Merdisoma sp. JLR.KK006]|uniref:hypothetical protein n=1 Tax=Candidatus Merdisoma sp. JLR.KK006 TaxID=3112626 RepID=UPI002FF2AFD1
MKERAEYFIDKNKNRTPEYKQYQYYTDFLKKVSDDILDELVREDLPLFCEEIRRGHLKKNLSVSKNKITAYDETFVDKMLEENEKEKEIKEKAKELVDFFDLHKRLIIDNINNLAKEIYADLICILLLEVPGEVYLKNVFNSLDELAEDKSRKISLKDTIINIRAALIIQCMQVEQAEKVRFPYKWEKNLMEKTFKNNQNDLLFCDWLKDIYRNISIIENLEKTIIEIRNFVEQHKIELKNTKE